MIVSDTESQAVNFLGDIKTELKDNEDLINLFKVKEFIKDTGNDIIVAFEDGFTFRIIAKGSEQRVRGTKWNNLRPDLIVCDDLESDEQVYNRERREKFKRWFEGALLPSMSKGGIVRVVGTILHMDSLLNNLMPESSLKSTIVEPLKEYNFVTRSLWKSIRYRAHNEDFTHILWPDMYTAEYFQRLKEDLTNKGLSDIYAQEYLNYPIDETISYFKRSDFLPQSEEDKKKEKRYYVAIDFAVSTVARSDYTAIAVVGVDEKGIIHVEDMRRGRWDSLEVIDEMFAVDKRYKPDLFVVERGTIEKSLGPVIRAEMLKRNRFLPLHPMTPTKDKQTRARAFQARLRAGGVRFDKDSDWYHELEDEMVRFPKSRHDDQVDALSWVGLILDQVQDAATEQEREEEEYHYNLHDSGYDQMGRNVTTGY
jgi:predicted phage terminase large subunit-like protein